MDGWMGTLEVKETDGGVCLGGWSWITDAWLRGHQQDKGYGLCADTLRDGLINVPCYFRLRPGMSETGVCLIYPWNVFQY